MASRWAKTVTATPLTSVTTEQFFDVKPSLNPGERITCEVKIDFPSTPTDDAIVSAYGTLERDADQWDDSPIYRRTVDKGTDPHQLRFTIGGVPKFRIGVQRDGSTDTITSADFSHQLDNVSL